MNPHYPLLFQMKSSHRPLLSQRRVGVVCQKMFDLFKNKLRHQAEKQKMHFSPHTCQVSYIYSFSVDVQLHVFLAYGLHGQACLKSSVGAICRQYVAAKQRVRMAVLQI